MDNADKRYGRQVMMPEIGEPGQARLASSRVVVVGAGGLGSPLLYYLAAAGVGNIEIADFDVVEESNLNRQILHGTSNIGESKVASAIESLAELNPSIRLTAHRLRVDSSNLPDLVRGKDLVIDAVDSFGAKFIINDVCVAMNQSYIHGGATGLNGQIYLYRPGCACLRCMFPSVPASLEKPQGLGILGATAGVIGSIQALVALRFLLDIPGDDAGILIAFDGLGLRQSRVRMKALPKCLVCGPANTDTPT
jgi:molybdopterin/thiamine biosynthesis adenylyltransferase